MRLLNILLIIAFILCGIALFLGLSFTESVILFLSILLVFQGIISCYGLLYSFLKPINLHKVKPPRVVFGGGYFKYSLILPAKNEEKVIGDTLKAMSRIDYPKNLYEVLLVVREDDEKTISAANKAIASIGQETNIRLIKTNGRPINKPNSLNKALKYCTGQVVAVFDAEDEPHPEILKSVDEMFITKKCDLVQAGVQLISVDNSWFSCLNCLEYYFWFKSILPFMSGLGSTPLGGNTCFFKKYVLENIGGWDETCLTEDADVGIRASVAGYKTKMVYLEEMATLEETPSNEWSFIRQRTRWNQGYLQILFKKDWLQLPTLKLQFMSFYLLLQPLIHHFIVLTMVAIPFITWYLKAPLWLAMFSWMPGYFLLIQFGLYFLGLQDLKKYYHIHFSKSLYLLLPLFFIPYQLMLAFAFFRAVVRLYLGVFNWEKTSHQNWHRKNAFEPLSSGPLG